MKAQNPTSPTLAAQQLTDLLDCRCNVPPAYNSLTPYHSNLLYLRLKEQDMYHYLFHDGRVNSLRLFQEVLNAPCVWAYAGFSKKTGEPMALALLEGFQGRTARMHFTFFKGEGTEKRLEVSKAFLALLFENGTLSCVRGLTPVRFRHSWHFALKMGFSKLGIIPGACGIMDKGGLHYEDGMLLLYTPPTSQEAISMRGHH